MHTSSLPPFLPSLFFPTLFFAFRLVYIPASILSHSGHGLPYANAALALCATFGMEFLTRRSRQRGAAATRAREIWFVVVALLLLGLFPEEAPTSIILWAAIGAVWGRLWPGTEIGTQICAETTDLRRFLSASICPFSVIRVLFSHQRTQISAETTDLRRFLSASIRPFSVIRVLFSRQATRPADTGNDENRRSDCQSDLQWLFSDQTTDRNPQSLFSHQWVGWLVGGLLGVTGLLGPGSWLMAGALALWVRLKCADC